MSLSYLRTNYEFELLMEHDQISVANPGNFLGVSVDS